MSIRHTSCGCSGGVDGYTPWHSKCEKYPNCEWGIEEAEIELRNRKYQARPRCKSCNGAGFKMEKVSCKNCRSTGFADNQCCGDDKGLCCEAK